MGRPRIEHPINQMESILQDAITPGLPNASAQIFFNLIFALLFVSLVALLLLSDYSIHVWILLGIALALFVSINWFILEDATQAPLQNGDPGDIDENDENGENAPVKNGKKEL